MNIRSLLLVLAVCFVPSAFAQELLNASYDVSRELFDEWQKKSAQPLKIRQSHGGSSKQARTVADGLPAEVTDIVFGGWDTVTKTHFADGGVLDKALLKAPAR